MDEVPFFPNANTRMARLGDPQRLEWVKSDGSLFYTASTSCLKKHCPKRDWLFQGRLKSIETMQKNSIL